MHTKVVTISGLPGSGKSTAAILFAEKTGLHYFNAGMLFRDLAAEYGVSLLDFERHCEENPEIDRELDARQVWLLKQGNIVLEGRLSGWLAHRFDVEALKIWLSCNEQEVIRRLTEREGGKAFERQKETQARIASEKKRYWSLYNINLDDLSIYDLIIDTTNISPPKVVNRIFKMFKA